MIHKDSEESKRGPRFNSDLIADLPICQLWDVFRIYNFAVGGCLVTHNSNGPIVLSRPIPHQVDEFGVF